ncbi:MAG: hypothetical protein A3F84_00875 [Candidatus Handelsmanbacteria bacterium RIFCSPLOWO2_12_FULL_64_10]|uniref:DUF5667 domain-containing protein n=1 Tax=Handelsmanbacteria sp. (strain RIFCSPLOWO2_12_FULL_64_10) TaxID=1817868 RepID=A0A1F6C5J1_HANXR|nr:MAG: hypothetical protein A3F84_00875 [Candidatus Handelsmanbacteria bacterium RIFCSPLOWO2_12_FULL_64_10]
MKSMWIPTATLALWLAASPGVAEEKADVSTQAETAGSVAAKTERQTSKVMFGQMTAVQAQLGLHRGGAGVAQEMKTSARTQAEALTAEAEAVLGADATPQEIREFFRARVAGYGTVAEMRQDIAVVLGPNPSHGAVKAYLLLRHAEMKGLSDREPDFEALRAEVKALGDVKVGELRGLLREKIRISVDRGDADRKHKDDAHKKEKDDADAPEDKRPEGSKDEHKVLHAELKAEHKAWHEEQKEAREEKLEAKIEARLSELEANVEARLAELEAHREKIDAKIEAKQEKIQMKAEVRRADLEAQRQKIEAKAEARQKTEVRVGRDEEEGGK